MNYTDYVATISNLTVIGATEANFVQNLPQAIAYAENRMYRELDLLDTVIRDIVTLGNRNFTLPQNFGRFVVTNGVNAITPSGQTDPNAGIRHQMVPVSLDYMNAVWPTGVNAAGISVAGLPECYAAITDQTFVTGPVPNAPYTLEIIGTIRPTPLSAFNTTTYLSLYLPDLFVAASMVFMSGYQQNFGAQSDNPQMATSWEGQYTTLFASANVEEMRKKYASGAWGSLQPTPIATPGR